MRHVRQIDNIQVEEFDDEPLIGLLNDEEIMELCREDKQTPPMMSPFVPDLIRILDGEKVISYGLGSVGYDIRPKPEFKIVSNATQSDHGYIDPKAVSEDDYVTHKGDYVIIPPNGFILASTVEYFHMPEDVMAMAMTKSTYARVGIQTLVTPLEPGWEGELVLEFANLTSRPVKFYANEGCVQLLFFRTRKPRVTYADRKGKYQGQRGITLSRT